MGHAGSAIKAMREAQGLSIRGLAKLSVTSPTYLSEVERGLRTPSDRWIKSITDALSAHLIKSVA